MSIFKTTGIVLKIDKLGQKDFVYTIFTMDYGKIKANKKFSKTEKSIDIGYIINFEIETSQKRDISKIRNIKIKYDFLKEKRNFAQINNYLFLIKTILEKTADGIVFFEINEIIEKILILENLTEIQLILMRLKIINISGELNIEHKNKTIKKILKFTSQNKINKILLLKGIDNQTKKELEKIF